MNEQMNQPGRFCSNCGAQIFNPQQAYCLNCGAQLGGAPGEVKEYNLITAWLSFFKRYADFKGRSRRQEYWYAYLANMIIGVALYIIQVIAMFSADITDSGVAAGISIMGSTVAMIYSLATIIPNFAIQTRRLHDTGRSGKLLLLWFIPGVLSIITIVTSCVAMAAGVAADRYGMYYNYYDSAEYLLESMVATSGVVLVIALAMLFLSAIASVVLSIMFIVFFCQEGQRGENKYGRSPK